MNIPKIVFIVPYRDRKQQQLFFANHMKSILADVENYEIFYIHQNDNRTFNRGAIKNIGFIFVKQRYPNDYKNITIVFNDVDTMPFTKNFLDYETRKGVVKHFYGFKFALGGIVSINGEDFENINGFPNLWSWGYEDNELNNRCTKNNIHIDRSKFFPILDKNILQLSDGITRTIDKSEIRIFNSNTKEGVSSIYDLNYELLDDGFVNVTAFETGRKYNYLNVIDHDLRKPINVRGKPRMKMFI